MLQRQRALVFMYLAIRVDDSSVTDCSDIDAQFQAEGRVWVRNAVAPDTLTILRTLTNVEGKPGARLSNQVDLIEALNRTQIDEHLSAIYPNIRPVRFVSFDKTPSAHWAVPWHQDRVIAVKEKSDIGGFKNWSQKAGIWHCEPPQEILESMLFIRIHLDSCTKDRGAMEIALGSHCAGIIGADEAADVASNFPLETTRHRPATF